MSAGRGRSTDWDETLMDTVIRWGRSLPSAKQMQKQSRQAGPGSVLKHILPEDFWRGPWETKVAVLRNWVISVLSEVVLDRSKTGANWRKK